MSYESQARAYQDEVLKLKPGQTTVIGDLVISFNVDGKTYLVEGRKKRFSWNQVVDILMRQRKQNPRRRSRARNPRFFVLTARKNGGPLLKYVGGVKFATKGRAVLFGNRESAATVGKLLRLQFPVLKRYTLTVQ